MRPLKLRMQAFGSYVEEQILDFETALSGAPFVLIHGATGAGKTTILDAIVFALYGESSGDVREGAMLRSSAAPPERVTEVEYTFALGRRRYRVLRSPSYERMSRGKMTRRAAAGELYRLPDVGDEGEEVLLDSNVTEVSKRIGTLIGFDADQFRQVILLPQGQFQRFLLAEVKDRSAIMQRIFRTERYRRLEEALTEEALVLERASAEDRARIGQMLQTQELASAEELRDRIDRLDADTKQYAARLGTLEKTARDARRAREQGAAAEMRLGALAEARKKAEEMRAKVDTVEEFRRKLDRARRAMPAFYKAQELRQADAQARRRAEEYKTAAEQFAKAQAASRTAQELLKREEVREAERTQLAERIRTLTGYSAQAAQLTECRSAVERLRTRTARAQEEKTADAAALTALTEEIRRTEQRIAACDRILATEEAAAQESERLNRCRRAAQEEAAHAAKLPALKNAEQAAGQAFKDAEQHLNDAKAKQRRMQLLYDLGSAARLAEKLADGTPCPVCGAISHPHPAVHAEDIPTAQELDAAAQAEDAAEQNLRQCRAQEEACRTKRERAEQDVRHARQTLTDYLGADTLEELMRRTQGRGDALARARSERSDAQTQLDKAKLRRAQTEESVAAKEKAAQETNDKLRLREGEMQGLEAQLPEEYRDMALLETELNKVNRAMETANASYLAAQRKEKETGADFARAETELRVKKAATEESAEIHRAAAEAFAAARTEAGFASEEEYRTAVDGRWSEAAYQEEVEARIKKHTDNYNTALELLKQAETAAAGLTAPDMPALIAAETAADAAVKEASQAQGSRMERLAGLRRMAADIAALEKTGEERAEKYRIMGKLAQVAAAKPPYQVHFQTYVLRSILSDVIEAANARLVMMSRGRYRLVHGEGGHKNKWWGLEIDVFDEYTGLPRGSRTLSGGETFLASLSLALGLSDVVQHYAGGMHLDMIFIDEGFGSLDSETLDVAVRALLEVQREGGRLVGIISHVEELRARIPVHLLVERTAQGSRARFTEGGTEAL